jgi:predicted nuclease of predicted toxin-antitoxin system
MARLYLDENLSPDVLIVLRELGHDVTSVLELGNSGDSDAQVLAFAISQTRAVVTINRWDFVRLHRATPDHAGIVVCSIDKDVRAFALRLHDAITFNEPLAGKLIRLNLP